MHRPNEMTKKSKKEIRKDMIKNYRPTPEQVENEKRAWEKRVIHQNEYYDIMDSDSNPGDDIQNFEHFIDNATTPTGGKFAERLFKNIMEQQGRLCIGEHKNGIDFIVKDTDKIDVKLVRHLKHNKQTRFRRYPRDKQLPGVIYAYVIFWKDCSEIRAEREDVTVPGYDCEISKTHVNKTWEEFPKKNITFPNKLHKQIIKTAKYELATWLLDTYGLRAHVISRGDRQRNEAMMRRKWGPDNFYEKRPENYDLKVLLRVDQSEVYEVWSYPMNEIKKIHWKNKNIGTSAKEIIGFDPNIIDNKYIFNDLNDFKDNFYNRFKSALPNKKPAL
jgi:hypothetical protein